MEQTKVVQKPALTNKELEDKVMDELQASYEDGLFPGQRQVHIQRALVYVLLLTKK